MASCPIPKIDSNNNVIGVTTITEARKNGWPRRVARIFIFNEKGEVLIQKRSSEARIHPDVWDCSGGHVDIGESYNEAGRREVLEELSVNVDVESIGGPTYFEDTFYQAMKSTIESRAIFNLKLNEVVATKWVTIDFLTEDLKRDEVNYTPWVCNIWTNYKQKLIQ